MKFVFRKRSSSRELNTDFERISRLKTAFEAVISEFVREREGLKVRIEAAQGKAAFLIGSGLAVDLGYNKKIASAERDLNQALDRLKQIDAIMRQLVALERDLALLGEPKD